MISSRLCTKIFSYYPLLCCCVHFKFIVHEINALHLSSTTNASRENIKDSRHDEIISSLIQEKQINNRRLFLQKTFGSVIATAMLVKPPYAVAEFPFSATPLFDTSALVRDDLAIEEIMLKLLPVKNPVFRYLEKNLYAVSVLKSLENKGELDENAWIDSTMLMQATATYLDKQRSKLEPVFNQEDSTALEISKAERGERLVEELRDQINYMISKSSSQELDSVLLAQRKSLRLLSKLGELLVDSFPYNIPSEGKFSYLPRLLGRCTVTFTVKRISDKKKDGTLLGNVTVIADGYLAPITAGNFVDLSLRDFYTGLPAKAVRKRLGVKPLQYSEDDDTIAYDIANTIDKLKDSVGLIRETLSAKIMKDDSDKVESALLTTVTNLPILGSYGEGFYDPLTAKPRRIPLEVLVQDPRNAELELLYNDGFSGSVDSEPELSQGDSVLSFDIPGLVALNHPDKNLNGGSSEFFSLRDYDLNAGCAKLLDGKYAPFGYIVSGSDVMERLKPEDIITSTFVSEWGQLNLKRVRGNSLADAMNTNEDEKE